MTTQEIVKQLKAKGSDAYKHTLRNHGIKEPFYGVKIEELKKIQKAIKKDHELALELYDTGIHDAMYLAGLIADEEKMTKKDLKRWLAGANNKLLNEYTVPWVASESKHGREMALEWIDSKKEDVASAGWATYAWLVAYLEDDKLDIVEIKQLLKRVQQSIHTAPNRVRYTMNSFVIMVGSFVKSLTALAVQTGQAIGPVTCDMGDTSCKVPFSPDYIKKVQDRGTIGKKRKTVRC